MTQTEVILSGLVAEISRVADELHELHVQLRHSAEDQKLLNEVLRRTKAQARRLGRLDSQTE